MTEEKATRSTVLEMVRSKQITSSRGAELLEMPLQDFLELMAQHHIPVLGCDSDEIRHELKSLKKAFVKTKVRK